MVTAPVVTVLPTEEPDVYKRQVVSNIHKDFETIPLQYIVGSRSDHTLILGDIREDYDQVRDLVGVFPEDGMEEVTLESGIRVISLSTLFGRSSVVSIGYEYRLF